MIDIPAHVTVVSPHLDDAIWSLGALITHMTFTGTKVNILTVFAGDPDCQFRSGVWDERAGFETVGAASRARRREDVAACDIVGARPIHLPFLDGQYRLARDGHTMVATIDAAMGLTDMVMIPGWPLANPDHAWAATLALHAVEHTISPKTPAVVLYGEEPYRTWMGPFPPKGSPLGNHREWETFSDEGCAGRKLQAMRQYETQLELLASEVSEEELGGGPLVMSVLNAAMDPGEHLATFIPR